MSQSRWSKVGLSYLLTLAVVSYTRYSWLPWIVTYLHQRKYNSWSAAVSSYGLLLSFHNLGHYVGQSFIRSKTFQNSWYTVSFMALTASFMATCFITRYIFILLLFFFLGMFGTILSGVSLSIDKNTPSLAFLKKPSDVEVNNKTERSIVAFAFVMLISGYLYNSAPLVRFPAYNLILLLAVFCILIVGYYFLMSRIVKLKSKFGMGNTRFDAMGGGGSSSPQAGSYGRDEGSTMNKGSGEEEIIQYEGEVPANFLSACGGDQHRAQSMYGKCLAWRKRHKMDAIYDIPQQHFYTILQHYPHGIHGYSLDGCAVVYEILGRGNMGALKQAGVSIEQIVWHFALRNELVFDRLLDPSYIESLGLQPEALAQTHVNTAASVDRSKTGSIVNSTQQTSNSKINSSSSSSSNLATKPVRKLMTVLDVGGIGITSLNSDVIQFIKRSGELIDNYYPEQVKRLVIVNAPRWFSSVWTVVARVLPESVQAKINILYDCKGLDQYIHVSQRPAAYGGVDVDLGEAPGHLAFLALEKGWQLQLQDQKHDQELEGLNQNAVVQKGKRREEDDAQGKPKTTTNTSSNSHNNNDKKSSSEGKMTYFGWMKKQFEPAPKTAFLGEKNRFRYNASTGTWDMDVDSDVEQTQSSSNTAVSSPDSSRYQYAMSRSASVGKGKGHNPSSRSISRSNSWKAAGRFSQSTSSRRGRKKSGAAYRGQSNEDSSSDESRRQESDSSDSETNSDSQDDQRAQSTSRKSDASHASSSGGGGGVRGGGIEGSTADAAAKSVAGAAKVKMTPEQLEEHGLVLAIQAAHLASTFKSKNGSYNGMGGITTTTAAAAGIGGGINHHHTEQQHLHGEYDPLPDALSGSIEQGASSKGSGDGTASNASGAFADAKKLLTLKMNAMLFLLVLSLYFFSNWVYITLVTLVPVWLVIPSSAGGMEYNVQEVAFVMSSCSICVLAALKLLGSRCDHFLKASPVRTLRISCAILAIALFLLPLFLDYAGYSNSSNNNNNNINDINNSMGIPNSAIPTHQTLAAEGEHLITVMSVFGKQVQTHAPFSYSTFTSADQHNFAYDYLHWASSKYRFPHHSLLALQIPSFLLAVVICSLQMVRRSSGVLLHLTLSSTFHAPDSIRFVMNSAFDICGPTFACLLFSVTYGMRLKYPLDSSHFFSICGCMMILVYIGSIFLTVQFRGDYGVMTDYQEPHFVLRNNQLSSVTTVNADGKLSLSGSTTTNTMGSLFKRSGSKRHLPSVTSSSSSFVEEAAAGPSSALIALESTAAAGNIENVLSIPLGDIRLLFSSSFSAYGSKLYNLKDDFKDV